MTTKQRRGPCGREPSSVRTREPGRQEGPSPQRLEGMQLCGTLIWDFNQRASISAS